MKKLIVNADDLGYAKGINRGVIEAHERGIVTSTSLIVNGGSAEAAVQLIRNYPELGVGLHFAFVDAQGRLLKLAEIEGGLISGAGVRIELQAQLKKFQGLVGRMPDHLDSHYHVHALPGFYPHFKKAAEELGVSLRDSKAVKFISSFFGRSKPTGSGEDNLDKISAQSLLNILHNLSGGVSELMCHPGYATPDLKSSYNFQRKIELKTLTDPRIKEFIEKERIQLINFSQI